mmetsp:Transcript_23153/g.34472  ORF Transcript_23153/g.34472 Transcript_23153/m.34472 type:complete len:84 (+) Transcript_23153:110-361(+)
MGRRAKGRHCEEVEGWADYPEQGHVVGVECVFVELYFGLEIVGKVCVGVVGDGPSGVDGACFGQAAEVREADEIVSIAIANAQ